MVSTKNPRICNHPLQIYSEVFLGGPGSDESDESGEERDVECWQ
jgi:hypothetical protein